ncbi:MAG: hypothetical protein IJV98_06585 [Clostridia bacterium]|nr:hypothetical protein [Clostridia bacterium]
MDHRRALSYGSILTYEDTRYIIDSELCRGIQAIVYRGYFTDALHGKRWVLIKELFPFDESGRFFRDENDGIVGFDASCGDADAYRHGFARVNAVLGEMQDGEPLRCFTANGTDYAIFDYTNGRSLGQETEEGHGSLKAIVFRMIALLDMLARYHANGMLHFGITPDHIFLMGEGEHTRTLLMDCNGGGISVDATALGESALVELGRQGYTAPEIRTGGDELGVEADLYSVAAVFYFCLTGCVLTPFQMAHFALPELAESEYVKDAPDTARSMVRQILVHGLQALPKRRYASASMMRGAFLELIDRIDCVGITHWALWESGKRTVTHMMREHPAFALLSDEEALYPMVLTRGERLRISVDELIRDLASTCQYHAMLIAPEGMGKTTALFHTLREQSKKYSPTHPAFLYIPLFGWEEGSSSYIQERILENLYYQSSEYSYDDARQALTELLLSPLRTRAGKAPLLILLLDGLDEVKGDRRALQDEILALSRLPGVGILLTGSEYSDGFAPFEKVYLAPQTDEIVRDVLSRRGITEESVPLLQTPLMLALFLKIREVDRSCPIPTCIPSMIETYFLTRLQRAIRDDGETAVWQSEVALRFVLPAVAGALSARGGPLTEAALCEVTENACRYAVPQTLARLFPKQKAIRDRLLCDWRRDEGRYRRMWALLSQNGFLICDEHGRYRLRHPSFSPYLCELDRRAQETRRKHRHIRVALGAGALSALAAAAYAAITLLF